MVSATQHTDLVAGLEPIRVVPAPRHRPPGIPLPVGGEAPDAGPMPGVSYLQDALEVDFRAADDEQLFGPQPTCAADLPDPQDWAAHIAQAIVEVMHGVRPPAQVLRWTSPEVYAVVARRGSRAARRAAGAVRGTRVAARRRVRVTRVLLCQPVDDVVEASVVLVDGPRVRALAIRLEGRDGRWVVTALQVG